MLNKTASRMLSAFVVTWLSFGCSESQDKITLVAMDLIPCLGEIDTPEPRPNEMIPAAESTCRETLNDKMDLESPANACLLLRLSDSENYGVPFKWQDGRLGPPLKDVPIETGRRVNASMVFLSQGGNATLCDSLSASTACADMPNCLVRLSAENVVPQSSGETLITFTRQVERDGQQIYVCNSDRADAQFIETPDICDDKDNDCDGIVDEDFSRDAVGAGNIFKGQACSLGTGACRVDGGRYECQNTTSLHCVAELDGRPITEAPAPSVTEDFCSVDDTPANQGTSIDDDCDGKVDEGLPCFTCLNTAGEADDTLCEGYEGHPYCYQGTCVTCRLDTADSNEHAGCAANELCCAPNGALPSCVPTTDAQCTACNSENEPALGACDGVGAPTCNQNRECVCSLADDVGCSPDGLAPYCVAGSCKQCRGDQNADCNRGALSDRLCCDGQCVPTGVLEGESCEECGRSCPLGGADNCTDLGCKCGDEAACDRDGDAPFCDPSAETVCQTCLNDCHCNPDVEGCENGAGALKCLDSDSQADGISRCVECLVEADCINNENGAFCVNNKCEVCDYSPRAGGAWPGCDPEGTNPICRRPVGAERAGCTGCAESPECVAMNVVHSDPFADLSDGDDPTYYNHYCSDTGACTVCSLDEEEGLNYGCRNPLRPICTDTRREGDNNFQLPNRGCRACDTSVDNAPTNRCGGDRTCDPSGRCQGCSTDNNYGCGLSSPTPVCLEGVCAGCQDDATCAEFASAPEREENPEWVEGDELRILCVREADNAEGGRCLECDPSTPGRGCDDGAAPGRICGFDGFCRSCDTDAECALRYDDRGQCVDGQCKVCDVTDNAGCDDISQPVCSGGQACIACGNDEQCRRGVEGDLRESIFCDVANGLCAECQIGTNIGCDPDSPSSDRPICGDDNRCRGCLENGAEECPNGKFCVRGRCLECDNRDGRGCDITSDTPICNAEATCDACTADAECQLADRNSPLNQCVTVNGIGRCEICDPSDNAGCTTPGAQVCNGVTRVCGPCTNDAQCQRGLEPAVAAQVVCDEDTGSCTGCQEFEDVGCRLDGDQPICDGGTCRGCVADADCDTHHPGTQCVRGRCQECDPSSQAGCDELAPICGVEGACGPCESDLDCRITPDGLDTCIDNGARRGQCEACSPVDHRGCDRGSDAPACDPNTFTCRACEGDADCDGDTPICDLGSGRCSECQPADNNLNQRGCDILSDRPLCDSATRECLPCSENSHCDTGVCYAGRCTECDPTLAVTGCDTNPLSQTPFCSATGQCIACRGAFDCAAQQALGGPACYDGRCVECNPTDDQGCDAEAPFCQENNNGSTSCRGCNADGECAGEAICVDGECVGCDVNDPTSCPDSKPICDPQTRQCRTCEGDPECPDQCAGGLCRECDPVDNAGCDGAGATPICGPDGGCGVCTQDAQCALLGIGREYCVGGRCNVCDVGTNTGCQGATPICTVDNGCVACNPQTAPCPGGQFCVDGSCRTCEVGADAPDPGCDVLRPVCDGPNDGIDAPSFECRECANDNECPEQCFDGRCVECDPTSNDGCSNPAAPICRADTKECRGCQADAECLLNNRNIPICDRTTGTCVRCIDASNEGCENPTPICDGGECRACEGNGRGDCPNGLACVNGICEGCDPATNFGCTADRPVCNPADFTCDPCVRDADCPGEFCFEGACVGCRPGTESGCLAGAELCCLQNDAAVCVAYSPDGVCVDCDTGCANDANTCEGGNCRCGNNGICGGETPFCIGEGAAGICSECRDNGDCDAGSTTPYCDRTVGRCVGCNGDSNRCANNANGAVCVTGGALEGSCAFCDEGQPPGLNQCPQENRPVCTIVDGILECVRCYNILVDPATSCQNATTGPICVPNGQDLRGECVECLPEEAPENSGCDLESGEPRCDGQGRCRPCNDDANCGSSVSGTICLNTGSCGCTADDECLGGRVCGAQGRCRDCDPNVTPKECRGGEECVGGRCQ